MKNRIYKNRAVIATPNGIYVVINASIISYNSIMPMVLVAPWICHVRHMYYVVACRIAIITSSEQHIGTVCGSVCMSFALLHCHI